MRIFGVLFLFLNLVAAVSIMSGDISATTYHASPISSPAHILQQSISPEVGDGLPFEYVPQRPVIRTLHSFFEPQSILNPYSGLSDFCILKGSNKQRPLTEVTTSLPAFLIVNPHHRFT